MSGHHLGKVEPSRSSEPSEPSEPSTGDAEAERVYLFLSGADMEPIALHAAIPAARFIARAWVEARQAEIAPAFGAAVAPSGTGEVWGIVVALSSPGGVPASIAAPLAGRTATTDDGRTLAAAIAGDRMLMGDPGATIAAARYWELPPGFVARLRAALPPIPASPGAEGE